MREILFKAKRIDNGEWVEGYVFDDGFVDSKRMFVGGLVIMDYKGTADDRWEVGTAFYEVDPNTICQYTGLTDKNGNKIWENDIVKGLFYHGLKVKAVVAFKYGVFGLKWNRGDVEEFSAFTSICNVEYEIIGNIFDNPELLEVGVI